jgi:polyribonucleotide nucleotidyltransferase
VDGHGVVEILSANKEAMDQAVTWVRNIAFPPIVEVGEIYKGKVRTLMPYGAFVEILPGTDGLLHVSELEWRRVDDVSTVLKEGEIVEFKVVGKDPKNGKYKLSRKVLLPKPEGYVEKEPREKSDRGDRGDRKPHHKNHGERRENTAPKEQE